jgi:hypothetical protein
MEVEIAFVGWDFFRMDLGTLHAGKEVDDFLALLFDFGEVSTDSTVVVLVMGG